MGDHDITLTHRRPGPDITVAMRYTSGQVPRWDFIEAVDEYGNPALLTWDERLVLIERAGSQALKSTKWPRDATSASVWARSVIPDGFPKALSRETALKF